MEAQPAEGQSTRTSLELIYHVSRELTSALDLRTVLVRVLFLSMQTVGAMNGSIIVLDDNGKPVESAIIVGDQVHDHATQRLRVTTEKGLAGWVIRNRQSALIKDTSRDERWMNRQYKEEKQEGPKSAVSAPLMARESLVGVITLVHPWPGFFTEDHLALVQAIADQAGIAVLNARLYAESQRQARVRSALADSAVIINASLNLEEVLDRIMEQSSQALSVQAVSLALIEPESESLVFRAATGWARHKIINTSLKLGQGIAGWVAREGRGVIVPDVTQDERFDPEVDKRTGFSTHSIACAPIRYHGEVIGILEALNPTEGVFDSDALLVLTGIGSLAGAAIRHAQLYERLQAAHRSYRELFEDSVDPIIITDWQGRILDANRQAVEASEYPKDELMQMTIDQVHQVDHEQLGEEFHQLAFGDTCTYESQVKTRSGYELPVEISVHQVKIEQASQIQWILRDISERKRLDTMREDLISMIYHDLRSPLANVVSSLDVLCTMVPEEERSTLGPLLEIAMRSTGRIQRLTDSLLDLRRMEAGQPIGNPHRVTPYGLAREAYETVLPIASNKQQILEFNFSENLADIEVDPDMIRRVMTNLLENAIKYTPMGGKIGFGGEEDEHSVTIWVKDNGPGIPASEHERIFDKFSRLNLREAPKGLGLGLAYCRLAIQSHGGRIWVESEPGAGARFVFNLPTVKKEED